MRSLVGGLAGSGRTVLVSSHDLSELEQVCDWLVLIDTGRSLYQGPTRDLLQRRRPADWPSFRSGPTTSRPCGTCSSPGATPSPPGDDGLVVAINGADVGDLAAVGQPGRLRRRHGAGRAEPAAHHARRPLPLACARGVQSPRGPGSSQGRAAPPRPPPHPADRRSRVPALLRGGRAVGVLLRRSVGRRSPPAGAAVPRWPRSPAPAAAPRPSPSAHRSWASSCSSPSSPSLAGEFSGGTFRALLLRDPHRLAGDRRQAGRHPAGGRRRPGPRRSGTFVVSLLMAPTKDIATTAWFSLAQPRRRRTGLRHRARRCGRLGHLRHHPGGDLPLGPHRPRRSASPGPARSRTSSSTRGTPATGSSPARCSARSSGAAPPSSASAGPLFTAALYAAVAAAVTLVLVSRRDVTA